MAMLGKNKKGVTMKTIKITKEQWDVLELLENKVNGQCNGLGEITIQGMFDDVVYEVSRGSVDNNLNLIKQKEYTVDIYDNELFGKFVSKMKHLLWSVLVAEEGE